MAVFASQHGWCDAQKPVSRPEPCSLGLLVFLRYTPCSLRIEPYPPIPFISGAILSSFISPSVIGSHFVRLFKLSHFCMSGHCLRLLPVLSRLPEGLTGGRILLLNKCSPFPYPKSSIRIFIFIANVLYAKLLSPRYQEPEFLQTEVFSPFLTSCTCSSSIVQLVGAGSRAASMCFVPPSVSINRGIRKTGC